MYLSPSIPIPAIYKGAPTRNTAPQRHSITASQHRTELYRLLSYSTVRCTCSASAWQRNLNLTLVLTVINTVCPLNMSSTYVVYPRFDDSRRCSSPHVFFRTGLIGYRQSLPSTMPSMVLLVLWCRCYYT